MVSEGNSSPTRPLDLIKCVGGYLDQCVCVCDFILYPYHLLRYPLLVVVQQVQAESVENSFLSKKKQEEAILKTYFFKMFFVLKNAA